MRVYIRNGIHIGIGVLIGVKFDRAFVMIFCFQANNEPEFYMFFSNND